MTIGCFRMILLASAAGLATGAQAPPPAPGDEPWRAVAFLEGTWEAKTRAGSSGATGAGTYTFRKELGGHILARHAVTAACSGPAGFDCEHRDLLFIYQEAPGRALQAIYFDNEGHVIHYAVSCPATGKAVFLSSPSHPGPQFRLSYERNGTVMDGRFEMRMPGKTEWTRYLAWSGSRNESGSPAK